MIDTCKAKLLLATLVIFLLTTGCAAAKGYRGKTLERSKLASIKAFGATIHQVNDVEIGVTAPEVLLPAGKHKIYITINASNYNSPEDALVLRELDVELEARKNYVINSRRGATKLCAWPVSPTSGQPEYDSPVGCLTSLPR